MMRRQFAAALTAAAVCATAACDLNIEPTNVSGTVTARSIKYNPATKVNNYYLTVGGQTFRVYFQTYNDCPAGETYPKCKG
jgi:hypothetical protein